VFEGARGNLLGPALARPEGVDLVPDPVWKIEKNPAIEIKFPLHLSLDCLDALAGRKMCYRKTTGKRAIKRHAEKLLIYAASER
jgi:hypothetical protein